MRYDLLLQSPDPHNVPYDSEKVAAALGKRTIVEQGGAKLLRLKNGDVEVRPLVEGGKLIATELRVPLSDKLELIREAVVEGAAIANQAGVRLFDPQLSKSLTGAEDGLVADQFLRTARYAGEMAGVSEAIGASFQPVPEGMSLQAKMLIGIIVALVALYYLSEHLLASMTR